jgi:hypothetical protein
MWQARFVLAGCLPVVVLLLALYFQHWRRKRRRERSLLEDELCKRRDVPFRGCVLQRGAVGFKMSAAAHCATRSRVTASLGSRTDLGMTVMWLVEGRAAVAALVTVTKLCWNNCADGMRMIAVLRR